MIMLIQVRHPHFNIYGTGSIVNMQLFQFEHKSLRQPSPNGFRSNKSQDVNEMLRADWLLMTTTTSHPFFSQSAFIHILALVVTEAVRGWLAEGFVFKLE